MNKQELIDYCNAIKENKNQIINCIDANGIIKKIEQLDESKKVTVPQFVADWIEECKNDDFHLFGAMEGISSNQKNWIIGLEKMTTWNSSPVLGLTATRLRKKSSIM